MFNPELLRQAADQHEEIARKYRELALMLESVQEESPPLPAIERRDAKMGKKRIVYDDIAINGPSTAKDIQKRTGIPLATIYFVCQDSKLFKKKGQHWHLLQARNR